jgi:hypothetical protein
MIFPVILSEAETPRVEAKSKDLVKPRCALGAGS